jgi:hypothetical protein
MPIAPSYYKANGEPPLRDVLDDPIVHLVLARDRLALTDVQAFLDEARSYLRDRPEHRCLRTQIPARSRPIATRHLIR